MEEVKKYFNSKIHFCEDEYLALKDADFLAILTEWSEFKYPILLKLNPC